jgi:hypothetical protein
MCCPLSVVKAWKITYNKIQAGLARNLLSDKCSVGAVGNMGKTASIKIKSLRRKVRQE